MSSLELYDPNELAWYLSISKTSENKSTKSKSWSRTTSLKYCSNCDHVFESPYGCKSSITALPKYGLKERLCSYCK